MHINVNASVCTFQPNWKPECSSAIRISAVPRYTCADNQPRTEPTLLE